MATLDDGFNLQDFIQEIKYKKEQERLESERVKKEAEAKRQAKIKAGIAQLKSSESFYKQITAALGAAAYDYMDFFETDATNRVKFPFAGLGDVIDAVGLEDTARVLSDILSEMLGFRVEYVNHMLMGDGEGTVGELIRRGKEEDDW